MQKNIWSVLNAIYIIAAVYAFFVFFNKANAVVEFEAKIKPVCDSESGPCYTSLSAWEAAYGGIDFGACNKGDLICADKIAVAKIEGVWSIPDPNTLLIDGWVTGPNNYIKIYTVPEARHKGVLKSDGSYTGYTIQTTSGSSIRSYEEYIKIDGIAIDNTSSGTYDSAFRMSVNNDASENIISNSIIKRANGGSSYGAVSKDFYYGRYKVINSVIYTDKIPAAGIRGAGLSNYVEVSNSTIYGYGANTGIKSAVSQNNIVANFAKNFSNATGDYNCSTDATAPGINSLQNRTVSQISFKSTTPQNEDFHLEANSVCANRGAFLDNTIGEANSIKNNELLPLVSKSETDAVSSATSTTNSLKSFDNTGLTLDSGNQFNNDNINTKPEPDFAKNANLNVYYISPAGNDLNSGAASVPFKTFKYAFTKMKSGDTLIVKDGVYNQIIGEWKWQNNVKIPVSEPPSGTAQNYTTIKAENIRATVNKIQIVGVSYIKIEGLKSLNGVNIDGSNHIVARKIGAKGGFTTSRSSYITKEDVWSWNDNRYVIHNYKSDHIIDNRVIARLDDIGTIPGLPVGAISQYLTDNSVIANALLFDVSGSFKQPYDLVYSSRPNIGNNQLLGIIGFNAGSQLGGIFPGDAGGSNYEIKNSVIWGTAKRCIRFNTSGPLRVINSTCGGNGGNAIDMAKSTAEVRNNIFVNNGGGISGAVSVCENNLFYNSGGAPYACKNNSTVKPDIKWLPITPIPEKGANILKKYGIKETAGKFIVMETNENLWPWPYEDLIKQDLCENTAKGLCGTNKTLTKYIWEYLGNSIPPEIYGVK